MKKFSSAIPVAVLALSMASCSSTDEPAIGAASDITIGVSAPVASISRAALELPEGYTMHCILQLLDENNEAVGEQKNAVIDATTGTGTFTITATDQEAGVKALFWAEYIDASGKSVYNTSDLKAISYSTTAFDLSNADAMAATDAFCGKLDALRNGENVTLSRPFANINFVPSNPDKVAAAKKMTVTYTAPAAYNIFNGTADQTAELTFTNSSFDAAATPWFSTFVFAPVDKTALDSEIVIALSEGLTQTVTVENGKVPLNQNFRINIGATIGDVELSDITIGVGIDPEYNKPEAPKFEIGAYVNAAGEAVATADEAAGIVFYVGALADDAIANYDAKFADKTIKGYAVALQNTAAGRQNLNPELVPGLAATTWVNGSEGTAPFLSAFEGSAFATNFTEWKESHAVSGDNITEWYIPALKQLTTWLYMLYPTNTGDPATGTEAFKALFPQDEIFDRTPIATVNYVSCTINSNGNISCVRMNAGDTPNAQAAQITTATQINQSALCRPMITIFE